MLRRSFCKLVNLACSRLSKRHFSSGATGDFARCEQVEQFDETDWIEQEQSVKAPKPVWPKPLYDERLVCVQEIQDYLANIEFVKNLIVIDISKRTTFANTFIIADADGPSLLDVVASNLKRKFAARPIESPGKLFTRIKNAPTVCGHELGTDWIIVDFGTTIVHLFTPSCRAYYNLEELWAEAAFQGEELGDETVLQDNKLLE